MRAYWIGMVVTTGMGALVLGLLGSSTSGCKDEHDHDPTHEVHSSPYPTCDAIIKACHKYDFGLGAVNDCHALAHEAANDAVCVPRKDDCLQTCANAAAAAEAGVVDSGTLVVDSGGVDSAPAEAGPLTNDL